MLCISISFPKVLLWEVERCSAPLQDPPQHPKSPCKGRLVLSSQESPSISRCISGEMKERTHPSSSTATLENGAGKKYGYWSDSCSLPLSATALPGSGRYEKLPKKAGFCGKVSLASLFTRRAPSLEASFPKAQRLPSLSPLGEASPPVDDERSRLTGLGGASPEQ